MRAKKDRKIKIKRERDPRGPNKKKRKARGGFQPITNQKKCRLGEEGVTRKNTGGKEKAKT